LPWIESFDECDISKVARVRGCFGGSHKEFLCYLIIHCYNIDDVRSELDKTFGDPFIVETLRHEKSERKSLNKIANEYLLDEAECHKRTLYYRPQMEKKNTAERSVISKLSRIRKSFFAAIREGDKTKASELAKRYNSEVNRFLKTFQSSPQITKMYLRKVKSTFRIAENVSAGDGVCNSHDAEEVVENTPVSQANKKELKEFSSYQVPVSQSNTKDCVSTDKPFQAGTILPLATSSMVGAQTNGASETPDRTQVNDSDPHAENDDDDDRVKKELKEFSSYQEPVVQSDVNDCVSPDKPHAENDDDDDRVKKELKEFSSYQEPVVQSDVNDCVSPDKPHAENDDDDDRVKKELKEFSSYQEPVVQSDVNDCVSPECQADGILPLAMSPILANMISDSSEDVNDGNGLDDNASKHDELHDKKEVDEIELAVDHVDDIPIYVNDNVNDGNSYDANTFKDERLRCKEEDEKLEWPVIPANEDNKEDLDKCIRDRLQQLKLFNQRIKKECEPLRITDSFVRQRERSMPVALKAPTAAIDTKVEDGEDIQEPVFSTSDEQQNFSLWYENQLEKKARRNEVSRIPMSNSHPEEINKPLGVNDKPDVNNFLSLLILIIQLVFLVGKQDKAHVKCTCERYEQQNHGLSIIGLSVYYNQCKANLTRAMNNVKQETIKWLVGRLLSFLPTEEKSM